MKIVVDLAPETIIGDADQWVAVGSWMPEATVISLLVASAAWLLLRRRRRDGGPTADAPHTAGDPEG